MLPLETIQREFDDVYASAEHALSDGDVSAYITARMQIWEHYDKLDKQEATYHRTTITAIDDLHESSDMNRLLRHLASAQARLDEAIVCVWNDEWNNILQAYLISNPRQSEYKPKRITKPSNMLVSVDDPRYGLGNTRVTREAYLLAKTRLKGRLGSQIDDVNTEKQRIKRIWWKPWQRRA